MRRLRKYGYKLPWSPYFSAIKAFNAKDALARLIKEHWRSGCGLSKQKMRASILITGRV